MNEITRILSAAEQGDPHAAAQLLPLVYDELRKLAAARLAEEKPGQTLQATALVHEAYIRLVGGEQPRDWDGRGHFFAAAAASWSSPPAAKKPRRGAATASGPTWTGMRWRRTARPSTSSNSTTSSTTSPG